LIPKVAPVKKSISFDGNAEEEKVKKNIEDNIQIKKIKWTNTRGG
jgi:hypothetical protein